MRLKVYTVYRPNANMAYVILLPLEKHLPAELRWCLRVKTRTPLYTGVKS